MTAPLSTTAAERESPQHAARGPGWRWLLLIVLIAVVVRCGGLSRPLVGNFATKNAAYGMIARNFARDAAPFWRPTVDVLIVGEPGAHLLEVPLAAYVAGYGWKWCGGNLNIWGRLQAVFWSALTAALLAWLGTRWFDRLAGVAAGLVYALSPVAIIYGQSFMLEASVAFLAVAAVAAVEMWTSTRRRWWLIACGAALACLFLSKIYMLVICWPVLWCVPRDRDRREQSAVRAVLPLAITMALAVVPAAVWLAYVFSATGPALDASHTYYSLRDSATAHAWPPPVLRTGEFYRQLLDDAAGVVLTPLGLVLAVAGLVSRRWLRLIPWLLSSAVLLVALPNKFHVMNYYFVPALPPLCVLAGLGWSEVAGRLTQPQRRNLGVLLLLVGGVFAARFATRPAYVTPTEDQSVVAAAAVIQEVSQPDDLIIAVHGSTIDLLYACDRRGWAPSSSDPQLPERMQEAIAGGARFLVICHLAEFPPAELQRLGDQSVQVRGGVDFIVLDLAPPDARPATDDGGDGPPAG